MSDSARQLFVLLAAAAALACAEPATEAPADGSLPEADSAPICPSLVLAPEELRGDTPYGPLDLRVAFFGVSDCIEISRADLVLEGSAGDSLAINFPYPVEVDDSGLRFVPAGFDASAGFVYTDSSGSEGQEETYSIHVDVTTWQERERIPHDIDITVTFAETAFEVPPVSVKGTFCKWQSLLCLEASPARQVRN